MNFSGELLWCTSSGYVLKQDRLDWLRTDKSFVNILEGHSLDVDKFKYCFSPNAYELCSAPDNLNSTFWNTKEAPSSYPLFVSFAATTQHLWTHNYNLSLSASKKLFGARTFYEFMFLFGVNALTNAPGCYIAARNITNLHGRSKYAGFRTAPIITCLRSVKKEDGIYVFT